MNILHIDIETAPNTAHVWGLYKQNVGINQLMNSSYVMCVAAKWHDQENIMFYRHDDASTDMLDSVWALLDEADVVVHYNGTKFDIPTLNKEFLLNGMQPPAPFKEIDLLKTARKRFRFPSNKLDYVAKALGLAGKVNHWGHELWVRCMANDHEAWELMEEYNVQDVALLQQVYEKLLPWINNHPNVAIYEGGDADQPTCTNCGSTHVHKKGFAYNSSGIYQRYRCVECGTPLRSRYRENTRNDNLLTQER